MSEKTSLNNYQIEEDHSIYVPPSTEMTAKKLQVLADQLETMSSPTTLPKKFKLNDDRNDDQKNNDNASHEDQKLNNFATLPTKIRPVSVPKKVSVYRSQKSSFVTNAESLCNSELTNYSNNNNNAQHPHSEYSDKLIQQALDRIQESLTGEIGRAHV